MQAAGRICPKAWRSGTKTAWLLQHMMADMLFAEVDWFAKAKHWISDQHFSVDATLIESWASLKTLKRKDSRRGSDRRRDRPI